MKRTTLLLPLLALAVACGGSKGNTVDVQTQAVPVRVAAVAQGTLERTIELGAVAEAWESANMAPMMPGVVKKVHVHLGQDVKRGQLLVEMDTDTYALQAEQARRGRELAALQLQNAQSEIARARKLAEDGALSPQQLEQAELGLKLAEAQVAQADAAIKVVESQVTMGRLRAPFDGKITAIGADDGEYFSNMGGMMGAAVLVGVANLDPIRLDVLVSDRDLPWVKVGMEARVTADVLAGESFPARVEYVNAAAEPGSRTFRVRLKVENPEAHIKPGFFLRAHLLLEKKEQVLSVPEEAIEPHEGRGYVMVLDGELARRTDVGLGMRGDSGWEVTGVKAGDQVVIEGNFGLPDGSAVRAIQ